jgi:hypothetical protein
MTLPEDRQRRIPHADWGTAGHGRANRPPQEADRQQPVDFQGLRRVVVKGEQ